VPDFPTNPELEAAVVANADEDTPRLAYADWLDENGDPNRAAFIRVQCRIAMLSPADAEWFDLIAREDELYRQIGDRFRSLLPDPPKSFYFVTDAPMRRLEDPFQRGFPFFCNMLSLEWDYKRTEQFAEDLARLVAISTVRGIHLPWIPPARFAELVTTPAFGELRGLSFTFAGGSAWQDDFEVAAYKKLVEAPVSQHLAHLSLSHVLGSRSLSILAGTESLCSVRRLAVEYPLPSSPDLKKLLTAKWVQGLRHVECSLSESETAAKLADGLGNLANLHTLELSGELPAVGVTQLAASRFPCLVHFKARGLTTSAFQKLIRGNWFSGLRMLDLSGSDLGDKAVEALVAHPVSRNLRHLRLSVHALSKSGLLAFTREGIFPELLELELGDLPGKKKKVREADVLEFVSSLVAPRLRSLDLCGLPVGDEGAVALAGNASLAGLTRLYLMFSGVGEKGAKALAESPYLRNTSVAIPDYPSSASSPS
jgi:uncharacterized protein (TIGR02996 family)